MHILPADMTVVSVDRSEGTSSLATLPPWYLVQTMISCESVLQRSLQEGPSEEIMPLVCSRNNLGMLMDFQATPQCELSRVPALAAAAAIYRCASSPRMLSSYRVPEALETLISRYVEIMSSRCTMSLCDARRLTTFTHDDSEETAMSIDSAQMYERRLRRATGGASHRLRFTHLRWGVEP